VLVEESVPAVLGGVAVGVGREAAAQRIAGEHVVRRREQARVVEDLRELGRGAEQLDLDPLPGGRRHHHGRMPLGHHRQHHRGVGAAGEVALLRAGLAARNHRVNVTSCCCS
jgi:hypothetical protein